MPLALASNLESVFDVYTDVWAWVKGYYDKYGSVPDKEKVKKNYGEFEYLNTSGSLQFYIDEAHKNVATQKLTNSLIKAAQILQEDGPYEAINYITSASTKLVKDSGRVKDTDLVADYLERVESLKERVEAGDGRLHTLGITSGIETIDFHFGGWQPGDFIVIMGWTGSMKSWLARLFAINSWKAGKSPLVISLEMNKYQEGYRFDTILTQGQSFRNSQLTHGRDIDPSEYLKWAKTNFDGKHPFYLVTNEGLDSVDQNMIQAKIEKFNPDLVILDYHGLFDDAGGSGTETEKAKNLSKAFKRMAERYQVPIIDICAVTMPEGHTDRAPELYEVAWSKQLSYDADMVLSVYHPQDSQLLQTVSRKNRRGDLFAFNLRWDIDSGRIETEYE